MTTSGETVLSITRNNIILAALEDIGAYAPGMDTPTASEIVSAANRLNMMIKAFQAAGVGLWLNNYIVVPLQGGWPKYTIGPGGDAASMVMQRQTIGTAAVSGAATVTLTDATDVDDTNIIGIATDDNWIDWTTVNGVPVGNVVTLTAVLGAAAAAGNTVYFYHAAEVVPKPIAINSVIYWTPDGSTETLMGTITTPGGINRMLTPISREEYYSLSNFYSDGPPTQYYYDPQLTNGDLYVWPVSTDMSSSLIVDARIPIQTFTAIADEPDFPAEWFDALHYSLAMRLCPAYKVSMQDYMRIKELAAIALQDANDFDREQNVSMFLQPYSE